MEKIKVISFAGILLFALLSFRGISQEVKKFTLKEAQQYAIKNNYDIKNVRTDIKIAKKRVKENTAFGLPQVNASVGYNNNIELPVILMPDIFEGKPDEMIEIQFGTRHEANWKASVDQLLFSGKYIVGLMAAKAYVNLTETGLEKSEIEIKDAIAKAYYPIIILRENRKVFDSTLVTLQKMLYETREYYKSGFVEDLDVDQIQLMIYNMETTITNINNKLEIAYNFLKYQMGIKADEEIEITDKLEALLAEINSKFLLNSVFDFHNHIDYKMLKDQEKMACLDIKLKKAEYMPTLNAFYSYQQNAMRDNFDLFNFEKRWFNSQILGVQLDVPIFSSGNRKFRVQQSKLNLEKIKVQDDQLQQGLSLQMKTVRSEFNNAYLIYINRKQSLQQAEKIYQKTEIKYREGISNSLELSQTYNQYLSSQIDYLTAIFDLLNKKSDLEKILTKVSY